MILTFLTYLFGKLFKKKLNIIGEKSRELEKLETQYLNETYQSIKFIKLGARENFFLKLLNNVVSEKNKYEIIHFLVGKLPKIFLEMIILIIFTSLVIFLLIESENDKTIFGVITFLAFSSLRLLPSFITINNSYTNLSFFRSPFEIIYNMMLKLREYEEKKTKIKLNEKIKTISFKDVTFSYKSSENKVLQNITFQIEVGDFLGVIGSSGSGKSTLSYLLSGLIKPKMGKITLNSLNNEINEFDLDNKISYVPQDSFILDTTLEENIAFADHNHDIDQKKFRSV